MSTTKGNAPIKGLNIHKGFKIGLKKYNPEPYEAHMALMIQEFEMLPEIIKNMVKSKECNICGGDGFTFQARIKSGVPGLKTELIEVACPNQCYLIKAS